MIFGSPSVGLLDQYVAFDNTLLNQELRVIKDAFLFVIAKSCKIFTSGLCCIFLELQNAAALEKKGNT